MIEKMSASPGNPIDIFLHDLRGVGTIFILTPEGFQRRMTTAVDDHGGSPVGSYLTTDHPAYLQLSAGQTFVGPARVFNRQYVTRYTPILDAQGTVVGATVIGIDIGEQLDTLKRQIRSMQVGETGYYYIVDTTPGANFGALILHPYKEGQGLADFRMDNGKGLVEEMARIGTGEISYRWKNEEAGEVVARKKLVIFETLDDPKWIVAGGTSVDEFTALSDRIVWLVIAGLLGMAGAFTPGHIWRDAALHSIGLGFVFAMVFGHAPIIFPAVTRIKIPYHPALYLSLVLLHLTLALRVLGSLAGNFDLRHLAALLNGLVLIVFIVTIATLVRRNAPRGAR
jgi:hypothetical protein